MDSIRWEEFNEGGFLLVNMVGKVHQRQFWSVSELITGYGGIYGAFDVFLDENGWKNSRRASRPSHAWPVFVLFFFNLNLFFKKINY